MLFAVLFNYSVVLTDLGQLERARETLARCVEIDAGFIPAYINLGRVFERLGNIAAAADAMVRGVEQDDRDRRHGDSAQDHRAESNRPRRQKRRTVMLRPRIFCGRAWILIRGSAR